MSTPVVTPGSGPPVGGHGVKSFVPFRAPSAPLVAQAIDLLDRWPSIHAQHLGKRPTTFGTVTFYYSWPTGSTRNMACVTGPTPRHVRPQQIRDVQAFCHRLDSTALFVVNSRMAPDAAALLEEAGFVQAVACGGVLSVLSRPSIRERSPLRQVRVRSRAHADEFVRVYGAAFDVGTADARHACEFDLARSHAGVRIRAYLYFADGDARAAGICAFRIYDAYPQLAYGSCIGVRPEWRGKGVGRQIMRLHDREMVRAGAVAHVALAMRATSLPVITARGAVEVLQHDVYQWTGSPMSGAAADRGPDERE